jgi:GPI mannosyltransferase 3
LAAIAAAVVLRLLAVWFNGGRYHPDEHWQILEFAWYKLGHVPVTDLAWEFAARIRPGVQPWMAAGLIVSLQKAGLFSPFLAALILRLVSAALGLWVAIELCAWCLPTIRDAGYRRLAFYGSLFLWMVPVLHTRFSSEAWGGALTFGGLCLLFAADAALGDASTDVPEGLLYSRPDPLTRSDEFVALLLALAAGVAWGFAFFARFQMAAAIGGAGLWWLFARRGPRRLTAALVVGFLAASACNVVIDHWLYDEWVLTPAQYFVANVMHGKASTFGVKPWYMTFAPFMAMLLPPFSAALLPLIVAGCWWCRRHVFVWMLVPFVLEHLIMPHKEVRFMFPMIFVLGPLVALALDNLPPSIAAWVSERRSSASGRWVTRGFVIVNACAMATVVLVPTQDTFPLMQWVTAKSDDHPVRMFFVKHSLYEVGDETPLRMHFYEPQSLDESPAVDGREVARAITASKKEVLLVYPGETLPPQLTNAGVRCGRTQKSIPEHLDGIYGYHWLYDNTVWTVCEAQTQNMAAASARR